MASIDVRASGVRARCSAEGMQGEADLASHSAEEPNRRDFIVIAGQAFAGVGAALALWPFIHQMNPDASTQALASIEVDLAPVKEGQAITVSWRGKPVFIRNRTKAEIDAARAVRLADLKDPSARNEALPDRTSATDENRTKRDKANWLVLIGICTHLGCIPKGQSMSDAKGDFGGWFCPCHGSHYDTSGRIRLGPAPQNLAIPTYEFVSDTMIKIG
jgi:ubiquinol-cytochrome c reductase iron-sulfur subunit